jgi:hypothetical protein
MRKPQPELQARPAAPCGFCFWHWAIQTLRSQLTASAGRGANIIDSPKTNTDRKASDRRYDMDVSCNKGLKNGMRCITARISLSRSGTLENSLGCFVPMMATASEAPNETDCYQRAERLYRLQDQRWLPQSWLWRRVRPPIFVSVESFLCLCLTTCTCHTRAVSIEATNRVLNRFPGY